MVRGAVWTRMLFRKMCERRVVRMRVDVDDKDGRRGPHRPLISRRVLRLTWPKCSVIGSRVFDNKAKSVRPFLVGTPDGKAGLEEGLLSHLAVRRDTCRSTASESMALFGIEGAEKNRTFAEQAPPDRAFQNVKSPRRQAA